MWPKQSWKEKLNEKRKTKLATSYTNRRFCRCHLLKTTLLNRSASPYHLRLWKQSPNQIQRKQSHFFFSRGGGEELRFLRWWLLFCWWRWWRWLLFCWGSLFIGGVTRLSGAATAVFLVFLSSRALLKMTVNPCAAPGLLVASHSPNFGSCLPLFPVAIVGIRTEDLGSDTRRNQDLRRDKTMMIIWEKEEMKL